MNFFDKSLRYSIHLLLIILLFFPASLWGTELFLQLGHSGSVYSVAFSFDGTILASGSGDNTIKLWDVNDGKLLRTLSNGAGSISSVAFSPDGTKLVSACENQIKVWDTKYGKLLQTIVDPSGSVYSVSFDPDGEQVLAGCEDHTIKLWKIATREQIQIFRGHSAWVFSAVFSPDGSQIASGSGDHTVKIWEVSSGKVLQTFGDHTSWVSSVAFRPDGTQLVSGSGDNTVKVWDINNGQLIHTFDDHSFGVNSVVYRPDGNQIVSGSGDFTIKFWDVETGQLIRTLSDHIGSISTVAYHPNGDMIASGSSDYSVKLWDVNTGEVQKSFVNYSNKVYSVGFSPNGKQIASGNYDHTIKIWDAKNGTLLHTLSDHSGRVSAVDFSPDGQMIISASDDNTIKLWKNNGELLHTFTGHLASVYTIAYSPDGKQFASGSRDNTVMVWDISQRKLLHTLTDHSFGVSAVAFSPDGTIIASGSRDNTIKLWDTASGELIQTLTGHFGSVSSVEFSPDGQRLVSGGYDNTLKLWNVENGQLLRTYNYTDWISTVAFSPDGAYLISGNKDNTITIWDAASGQLINTLTDHSNWVSTIDFSNDGLHLVSGSDDNTIKIWKMAKRGQAELKMTIALLPGNLWIAFHPTKLWYNASLQGDDYAAVRFNEETHNIYAPVSRYYQKELLRDDLGAALKDGTAEIKPKTFLRGWYEFPQKEWWLGGSLLAIILISFVVRVLSHRTDPLEVAKRFFVQSYEKVESATDTILLLHTKPGQIRGVVTLWQEESTQSEAIRIETIRKYQRKMTGTRRFYLIYKEHSPSSEKIQYLKKKLDGEIIPLLSSILEKAVAVDNCQIVLKELEERYLVRTDPYAESKPIDDPIWFYGRKGLLDRLPPVLIQGQHVGIFGVRKVGKTSLVKQITQRSVSIPNVEIDCQAIAPNASAYFDEILQQLHLELKSLNIKGLPTLHKPEDSEDFRRQFLALYHCWVKSGRQEPFLIIMDEIDKFFPDRRIKGSERVLGEYVTVFKVLRGMAQTERCLVVLVVAYRPDVNRHNFLTEEIGENPMFKSYQEESLGFLSQSDTLKLIIEIGLWRNIGWDVKAVKRVYHYCGGHPLVVRYFASEVCEQGTLKHIDEERVEETAEKIKRTFRRNEIGNYYQEGIWNELRENEREIVMTLCRNSELTENDIPPENEDALTNLENFGVVINDNGQLRFSAEFFETWIREKK